MMTFNGSAPEGATPLDPDEREGLRYRHVTTRGELDELEHTNVQSGIRWAIRNAPKSVLTEAFLLRLHRRLFGEVWKWAGKFRTTEKNIGVAPYQIGMQLRMLLDDARFWVENQTYEPLAAAAHFHHRLVSIHLFPNGNGRHARIAANLYLQQDFDHAWIDWDRNNDLQTNNPRRVAYIEALRCADKGNFAPLIAFVGMIPAPRPDNSGRDNSG